MADRKRIVIVGGVAGGASAAARARRLSEEAEIIMLERGEHVSFANCGMPYYIGGTIAHRDRLLVQTPQSLARRFGIDVRTRTEALRIDRQRKELVIRDLADGSQKVQPYDVLILSPGAEPARPAIPGIDSPGVFTLRTLADTDAIKRAVDADKPTQAVIIGGGYIGLEMAEALRQRGLGVTLVELGSQVFGPIDPEMAEPIHQELLQRGVDLRLETSVTGIQQDSAGLTVHLSTGQAVHCGLVILAIGVKPEVTLARQAGLTIGERCGIVVDEHMRTSDPNIFAVGDAVEVADFVTGQPALIPLAGPANRQGRIAADNAFGRPSVYRRTQGTAICKVFELAVGMTGMSEKALKRAGMACEKVYVHPASHASYYPGASPISLKLLFDPASGKILGAQAVGTDGVDKRIDVLAVAIRAGMTVFDLEDMELSYAPPYGSAKDPINYAGFVAGNAIRGDVQLCHTQDALAVRDDQMLLDVRTSAEVSVGTIPGSVNIPVDDLRSRLSELPRDKELLVFCQVGLRGYLACRILMQNGFRCRNLTGGYKTFRAATAGVAGTINNPPVSPPACCSVSAPAKPQMRSDTGADDDDDDDAGPAKVDTLVTRSVDATGLQCPGPIMKLGLELETLSAGQAVCITASDPAFVADVSAWCHSTGHQLVSSEAGKGTYRATVLKKGTSGMSIQSPATASKNKTIVVFSSDFDRVVAAFIIANGAAAMGSQVTLFFTFWGLNVLRKSQPTPVSKTLIERMFGWMMPRGADRLKLSQMHMGGMGLRMIKGIMRNKNVASLPELIDSARKAGVRLVACRMSMDLMGIKSEEFIPGVEEGGVAMYLDRAEAGNVNLFI